MKRKTKILLAAYTLSALAALSLYSWAAERGLGWYRRTADYSAGLAFEETVRAVEDLSAALAKSPYVTDSRMGAKICAEAYARASAAEAALSTLPFSTQELEELSAFLNRTGDYAQSLCGQRENLSSQQKTDLEQLSGTAAAFAGELTKLRQDLNDGLLIMDSREKRLQNVGQETGPKLSASLLELEESFTAPEGIDYDGKYAREQETARGYLTEEEIERTAADFLGTEPEQLRLVDRAEGIGGMRCYRWEDSYLCVGRTGVQSMVQARIPAAPSMDLTAAREAAEDFLSSRGYEDLRLSACGENGYLADFVFSRAEDDCLWEDNGIRLSIALDDGSVYRFDASDYRPGEKSPEFLIDQQTAEQALPPEMRVEDCRRCVCLSPGGTARACYCFSGRDEKGQELQIWVDADEGLQWDIRLGDET